MTSCTDTNQAPPGRMLLVEPIPGVDAVNQAVDDPRRQADNFAAVANYDDLEVLESRF
jgi:hypothetical protein